MRTLLTTTAILLALPTFATAQEAAELEPVLVTGRSQGYVAVNSVTATKTDTPLLNVPQSINVVTREQLDDQALRSLGELLRYVPGTTVGQGEGNRDQITLRGQNTTADFFLDGVRDDTQYFRGLYNLERVEVLKGPYALIFGRGGGGGIINRVQKTPSAGGVFASVRASAGSLGAWDISADMNTPIGSIAALRLNGAYERLASHRDHVDGERYALNPHLAVVFGPVWRAGLSYEYVNDDRVPDRGVPSLAGAPLTGYRDRFFGVPGVNRTTLEAHIAKLRIDGALLDNVEVSTTVLLGDYDKVYTNVYANGPASSQTGTVPLAAYTDPTTRQNLLVQSNLVWDVSAWGMDHKILFGLEYGDQDSANQRLNGMLSSSTLSLTNPVFPTVTFPTLSRDTISNVETVSAYIQDQVSLGDHLQLVAGLRYDRFDITGVDLQPIPDRPFSRLDEKVSPRLGLIYKPQPEVSIYGSYSKSFLPRSGDQFLSLSTTQQNLEPEEFTNHEIGAKGDIRPNPNGPAAPFRLEPANATPPEPPKPPAPKQHGETRTEGFELAVTGRVRSNWQVSGGYAWLDARLQGNDSVRLAQTPEHHFSLWNRYDVNRRLGFGLGVIHHASQYAAIRTSTATTRLPAFTRIDAAAYYRINDAVELQLNIENLFDTTYCPDAHNNNNISTGAPLNARLTLSARF